MTRFDKAAVAKQLDYCSYCPKMCRHACPVSNADAHEGHTPQAKMHQLNRLRSAREPWTPASTAAIYACTGCRHCTSYCEHGNEPGLVLFAGRAAAERRGAGHPKLRDYPERFQRRDDRLSQTAAGLCEPGANTSETVFWPGCDAIDKGIDDSRAAMDLFRSLEIDISTVPIGPACGGYPLLAAGHPRAFRAHAHRVAEALNDYETVVINCSACLHTMRASYPAEGVELKARVRSLPEFLADRASSIPQQPIKPTVYYHDPCYLARYENVIEQPRTVLSRVAQVLDFDWSHADTECCGGAGLLPKTMPNVADEMARRRLREIAQRGGGTVVTACASCAFMLKSNAPNGVAVHDLAGYLRDRTG